MIQPKIQEVYTKIDIGDELPNEYDIVGLVASVPVDNQFPTLTNEKEIEFIFKGWLEDGRFLMHGIGQELAEGKVTHWLKQQQGIFFTPEEFETFKREFGKELLERVTKICSCKIYNESSEDIETYPIEMEEILPALDEHLLNNKI